MEKVQLFSHQEKALDTNKGMKRVAYYLDMDVDCYTDKKNKAP